MNRRSFVVALAALPYAPKALEVLASLAPTPVPYTATEALVATDAMARHHAIIVAQSQYQGRQALQQLSRQMSEQFYGIGQL